MWFQKMFWSVGVVGRGKSCTHSTLYSKFGFGMFAEGEMKALQPKGSAACISRLSFVKPPWIPNFPLCCNILCEHSLFFWLQQWFVEVPSSGDNGITQQTGSHMKKYISTYNYNTFLVCYRRQPWQVFEQQHVDLRSYRTVEIQGGEEDHCIPFTKPHVLAS